MSNSEQLCREFSLEEIKTATRNFDEELIIGKGGFGLVYKGSINNDNNNNDEEVVAIKRLSFETSKQGETEFLREIETLSKLQHVHLVCLKGYCKEPPEMILVYEYMSNGTLADHLYKVKDNHQPCLTWEERLNICIGAARGIDFLHREYEPGIIHRDIKDSNILLDENFVAKIADFGLAKLVKTSSESHTTIVSSTGVKGTFGYLDPEYFYTQRLSKKTHVYAFGVFLLVVLCGRPAVDNKAAEEQRSLAEWAQKNIQKNRVDEIIDPHLAGKISSMSLKQFVKVSQKCLSKQSKQRPTMEEVVLGLELASRKQPTYGTTSNQQNGWSSFTQMIANLVLKKKQSGMLEKPGMSSENAVSRTQDAFSGTLEKGNMSSEKAVSRTTTFSFLGGCNSFNLEDLLTSSAEVLGKGTFGSTYKAILEDGFVVVVKRFRDVTVGKEDFEKHMELVGGIKHENVVALRAYYYSYDEKLMVSDYYTLGSVATMLHGKQGANKTTLNWDTRVKIVKGTAIGIERIHTENGGKFVHGNIKSSNIFLNSQQYGCVSDLGTFTIMTPLAHPIASEVGYRAPELIETLKPTQASDVYSFGIFVLELLTAKSPVRINSGDEEIDLVRWFYSVIQRESMIEAVDPNLFMSPNIDKVLVLEMLQIAMSCLVRAPNRRPKIIEVVKLMNNF